MSTEKDGYERMVEICARHERRIAELERVAAEKVTARARERDELQARIAELDAENKLSLVALTRAKECVDEMKARADKAEAERDRLRAWLEHINRNADGLVDNMSDDALEGLPAPALEDTP